MIAIRLIIGNYQAIILITTLQGQNYNSVNMEISNILLIDEVIIGLSPASSFLKYEELYKILETR